MSVSANYLYWQENGAYWVDEYRRRRRQQPRYAMQELALVAILEANAPARVLEFGCGVGRHLSYVSKIDGIDVHGVDQSPTMLAGLKQWVADPDVISRAQLIEPTGQLPFADRSFDLVYSAEVLVHVSPSDIAGRLAEMVRVCRRAVIHIEPHAAYKLFADAHHGCWWHDLVELYAALGISTRRIGQPIDSQEIIVAELDPSNRLAVPGPALLRHMRAAESWLDAGMAEIVSAVPPSSDSPPMHSDPSTALTDRLASIMHAGSEDVEAAFALLPASYRVRVEQRQQELQSFCDRGVLSADLIVSRLIVDWESGDCAFAVAMLRMGARQVLAVDSWMNEQELAPGLQGFPGLLAARCTIHELAQALHARQEHVDTVFCNTVTEHVQDLVPSLAAIRGILRPNGYFFTNHDNYYQPAGSHDHGFLFYGKDNRIEPQGVACWLRPEKCAASEEHRQSVKLNLPWTWDDSLEKSRNPDACMQCFYYRRSQPWAHLIYQEMFRDVFAHETFFTGMKNSSLNKITTFQLRQFIVEAGFCICAESRSRVSNEPPDILLGERFGFHRVELTTSTMCMLAKAS